MKPMQMYTRFGLLIMLLAACTAAGSYEVPAAVSLPVTIAEHKDVNKMDGGQPESSSLSQIRDRLNKSREEELKLLDETSAGSADAMTKRYAQTQMADIAARMEREANASAVLSAMGYDDFAVCCGAEIMSAFLTQESDDDEGKRIRLIDAIAQQTGLEAGSVKIILVKNAT